MFETMMHDYAFRIILLIVCALATWIGLTTRKLYKTHVDNEEKEAVATAAALFVEQVFRELHGRDKLDAALDTARTLLEARGIRFSTEEMEILIQAAVGQFNDAFNSEKQNEGAGKTLETGEEEDSMIDDLLEDPTYM